VSDQAARAPRVPPAWFVHTAWRAHRALYRLSGGRFLWATSNRRGWGALHLTTTGRTSGRERSVIVGYIEDGPSLVVLAMNGWQEGQPGWWRNLEGVRTPSFDWRTSNLAGCAHARRQLTSAAGCGTAGSRSTRRWTRNRACGRPKRPSSSSSRPTGPRGIGAMVSAPVRMRRGRTATSLTRLRSSAPAGRPGAHVGRSHPRRRTAGGSSHENTRVGRGSYAAAATVAASPVPRARRTTMWYSMLWFQPVCAEP
jgi:hypothetical protein